MRSLMELLNNEYSIVQGIERNDEKARKTIERQAEVVAYPIECDAKTNELLRIDEELTSLSNRKDALMNDLDAARYRIPEYFNFVVLNAADNVSGVRND